MFTKAITYVDYNGTERTETFMFNMTASELAELDLVTDGGLRELLDKIVKAHDGKLLMKNFKKIIGMAYGIKSDDGRRFMKSEEITQSFFESPAYDLFFTELVTDPDKMTKFLEMVLPKNSDLEKRGLTIPKSPMVLNQ